MNPKKRTAINMIAQLSSFAIGLAINFVLTPYITKYVGKEIYGYVGLAHTFTGYVTVLTVAMNVMLNRYVAIKLKQGDFESANRYYSSVAISNIIGSVILIVPAMGVIIFLEQIIKVPASGLMDIKLLWVFVFVSFLINLSTSVLGTATFSKNRLDLAAKRNFESNIIKGMVLVGLYAFCPAKVWYVGFATLLCGIYMAFANIHYKNKLVPELKIRKNSFRWTEVKELVGVGIWNSINQLTQIFLNGLDLLITNLYINPLSMTLMSFSKTVPIQLMSFIGIVNNSLSPQMTLTYAEGNIKRFIKETESAIKVCGFLCSIPILGFIAFGPPFFRLWLSSLSSDEIQTIQILSVLTLLPNILDVYIYPIYTVNAITCKLKIPVLVSMAIGILNVIGVFTLLNSTELGVYAIKIVSSVLLFFRAAIFTPIYAARVLNVKWFTFYFSLLRGILASSVVLTIYFAIEYLVPINSWMELVGIVGLAGAIGYGIEFFIVLSQEERQKIKSMLYKKLMKQKYTVGN